MCDGVKDCSDGRDEVRCCKSASETKALRPIFASFFLTPDKVRLLASDLFVFCLQRPVSPARFCVGTASAGLRAASVAAAVPTAARRGTVVRRPRLPQHMRSEVRVLMIKADVFVVFRW